MVIEKIVIKSFGLITDMTLEFSDKVNVIEGQNESGKSTIAAFIKYMLYGFGNGEGDDEASERRRRINWNTGVAQGSMYVRVKDKRYLITRSTTPTDSYSARPTYKEDAAIIDLETGAPAFGKLSAGDVFFGVDAEFFDNTAFIGQVGDSEINAGSVKESIENILFSGSEKINSQRAANRISDKMQSLLHEGGSGGAIVDLVGREEALEEKLAACEEDNRRILEKEAELHEIKARRAEAEDKQAKLHELGNCYSNVMLIQSFDQLHDLEEELEQKTEAYNSFVEENTRAGFVPDEQYLTDLVLARKTVNESYRSLAEAQDAYTEQRRAVGITREIESAIERSDSHGGEAEVLKSAASNKKGRILSALLSVSGILMLIAAIVFEIVAAKMEKVLVWQILVGVAAVLALGLAVFFGRAFMKCTRALSALEAEFGTASYADLVGKIGIIGQSRIKRDTMALASENARIAVERARERYEEAKKNLIDLILKWGEEPPVSELGSFLDELEGRVKEYLEKKNVLLDEKISVEVTVREIRRTLQDKSEIDVRAQVSPLRRKALAGVNYDEIANGIVESGERIAEEDRLAFDVENELMLLKGRAGDPGEYYSRIQSIAARRRELQDKHKAYYIALGAIRSAEANLRSEISPRLGEYATGMMEIMTDRKYTSFDVSEGLKVSFLDSNGEKKSVDFLSGGTRDMAYIAVRCALIDMLYTEKPPICFDESFAHQDNLRARAMMRAIKQLSDEGCQSFIFTCRGREATLASDMISGAKIYKLSIIEEERV